MILFTVCCEFYLTIFNNIVMRSSVFGSERTILKPNGFNGLCFGSTFVLASKTKIDPALAES